MYYVPQLKTNDCGLASLKMLLATLNKDQNYLFMPFEEREEPYSYNDLIQIAGEFGCLLEGFQVDDPKEFLKRESFPCIAAINLYNGNLHSVLILKSNFLEVTYLDPAIGKVTLKKTKFLEIFAGYILKTKEVNKQKCPFQFKAFVKPKENTLLYLGQILSGVFLILGIYFLNVGINIIFPVLFLAGCVIFELFTRFYLVKIMKRMDDRFFDIVSEDVEASKKAFISFAHYKKNLLANDLKLILDALIICFLIVMTIMNGINYLLLTIAPIIFAIIVAQLIEPWMRSKEQLISQKEEAMFTKKNLLEFRHAADNVNKLSYKHGLMIVLEKYLAWILLIGMSIGFSFLNKENSIAIIAFYICLQIAIYQSAYNLLVYPLKQKEKLKSMAELGNYMHKEK